MITRPESPLFDIPLPPIPHPTKPGNLPSWISDQLHDSHPSDRRVARFHYCRKCGDIVITGLNDDWCAYTVTADPTPINRPTEIACIILARPTFNAWPASTSSGWELERRNPRLLPTNRHPIVPAHICGRRFPGFLSEPEVVGGSDPDQAPPY